MSQSDDLNMIRLYTTLMEEIKVRVDAISTLTLSGIPLPGKVAQEFCFLQIRMICELIALGCLVAHGDITRANRLTKVYQADKIISELEKLNPDFFPCAVSMTQTYIPVGYHLEPLKTGFITKPEFLKLYHERCGGILHRGSLRNLLSEKRQSQLRVEDMRQWVDKLQKLLDKHFVLIRGGSTVLLCTMQGPQGRVDVAIAKAPD